MTDCIVMFMFTGIIQSLGRLQKRTDTDYGLRLFIHAPNLKKIRLGDSIAVNGVCLTVCDIHDGLFSVDLVFDTIRCTNFSRSKIGDILNLELPLQVSDRLSGHIIQGHVDDIGKVVSLEKHHDAVLSIKFPQTLKRYIALKGSIAVNGVSLTIQECADSLFRVALIPYTLKETNLGFLQKGDIVNLEVDILARYLETLYEKK